MNSLILTLLLCAPPSYEAEASAALALAAASRERVSTPTGTAASPALSATRQAVAPVSGAESAPTPMAEVNRVMALLPKPEIGFVDWGAGDARWCIAAAERWPGVRVTGVEIDPARAAAARERVQVAGLSHRITIITGDAITTDVTADVGTAYLWPETLAKLKPRIEKLRAFASYQHQPPVVSTKSGATWIYLMPVAHRYVAQQPMAVWNGFQYGGPQCSNPNCAMCASIRAQIARIPPARTTLPGGDKPATTGQWVRRCNGRQCWMEWVPNQ